MCGVAVAGFGSQMLALNNSDRILLAVGGMSACLGGVVQAPVTAVLIIFEMKHQFALLPGLMLAGLFSELIARRFNRENFYEEVLTQDGHQMAHVVPPRDLRSWQNMPISAIAQFEPAVLTNLDEQEVNRLLESKPYERFPVTKEGRLHGVLLRTEFILSLAEKRSIRLLPSVEARLGQTISECQALLIESSCGLIVITDHPQGQPIAVVTLHDLLRAQMAMSDREG